MKRKTTAYRIAQLFFLTLFIVLLPFTVWAQETVLTTIVPSSHTLHIDVAGEGTILVDGVAYTKAAEAQVQRHHTPEIAILTADGYRIKTVLWGDEDVTAAFRNGKWTAPKIVDAATLTVTFEQILTPQTEETLCPYLWIVLLVLIALVIVICLLQRKKKVTHNHKRPSL